MIRVCHLITGLPAHGAERMLLKLVAGLDRQRFASTVISLMDQGVVGPEIEALGIPVLTVGLDRGRPSLPGLLRLLRLVRQARPDVLQGWMYHGNLAATLAAWAGRRVPVLWNIRQSLGDLADEKRLTRLLIRLSARLSGTPAHILYNALTSAEQHEALGFRPDRRVLIPNGFEVDRYRPAPDAAGGLRAELGLRPDQWVIGMAARDHPMKDHASFLQAAARVAERYPDARFLLAGLGVEAANARLQQPIQALSLAGRVMLLGEQRDMPRFFQSLDIAVLSSAWGEGFPNVLGEAMASGVPCVATEVGDAAAIIGATGRLVPPGEPALLAQALQGLMDDGREAARRLGLAARDRIVQHYGLPAIVEQYAALYAGCVANRGEPNF